MRKAAPAGVAAAPSRTLRLNPTERRRAETLLQKTMRDFLSKLDYRQAPEETARSWRSLAAQKSRGRCLSMSNLCRSDRNMAPATTFEGCGNCPVLRSLSSACGCGLARTSRSRSSITWRTGETWIPCRT